MDNTANWYIIRDQKVSKKMLTFIFQLAELEMLSAMFPSDEELSLDNPAIVGEINEWLEKEHFKVTQII